MQFNEFQRRLQKCDFNRDAMHLLSHMFEVQVEFSKHLDLSTNLIARLVDRIAEISTINQGLIQGLKELQRRGMADGIEVHSVMPDPEDEHG